MSLRNFIPFAERVKPAKPYPEYPLFPHANGTWCKKIRGKFRYFGPWENPQAALDKYLAEKDALHAGRSPRPEPGALTVKELANLYLNAKQAKVDAGELSPRTFADSKEMCDLVVATFGKGRLVSDLAPQDFADLRKKMTQRWGPVRLNNVVQRVRSMFKYADDCGLVDRPVRFGPDFKGPNRKTLRAARHAGGIRMFEAEELRKIIDAAGVQLKAMILLGVNCGFGNADVAKLPLSAVDLERAWVTFPRPKTGIMRRCPLWPETVAALREAIASRPAPKSEADAGLLFITKYGHAWGKDIADNPITKEMRKLLNSLGINGKRNFYALRHTFETIGGEAKDQISTDYIMGHASESMASVYRERISDERLRAVVDHVRQWLFGAGQS